MSSKAGFTPWRQGLRTPSLSAYMKTIIRQSLYVCLFSATLFTVENSLAQRVEVTASTTTAEGTLSEFGTQAISIKTAPGVQPVRYMSNTTTNYVDENGNPVAYENLKSGLPVMVYYTKVGDTLLATKIMVKTAAPAPVVIIEEIPGSIKTSGTVSDFGPQRIIIRSKTSPELLSYAYSKTTTYVDEYGQPISLKLVKTGMPVIISDTQVGDALVASKVIVRTSVATPDPVIEQKTTTTTTETTK